MRILTAIFLTALLGLSVFAQQQLKPGNAAPEFAAQDLSGQPVNLRDLQGKVVVLTFWSTKCQICHAEIPKLNQVADRYRGQDVVFLALSTEPNSKIEPYLKKNPFNFGIVPNSFGVILKYADIDQSGRLNIGFPAHFVINKQGTIEHRSNGWDKAANLDAQISRMLQSD